MKHKLLIALILLIAACQTSLAAQPLPRIIGGTDASEGTWPYMVSIHFPNTSGGHGCGGTLIAPNWVVTAAHCVTGEEVDGVLVYAGLYRQSDPGSASLIPIKRYIQHPQYDGEEIVNDIALLELEYDALEGPVTLNSGGDLPASSFVLGWGLTRVDGENSDTLQYLQMPLVSNDECRRVYNQMGSEILDTQICAGYLEGGKDSCQNDSGGPLLINTDNGVQQVGIVSFGMAPDGTPCAGAGSYGVYTRVSSFLDFIRSYVPAVRTASATTGASATDEESSAALAQIDADLTLEVPSLLWDNGDGTPLRATLRYLPGSSYSFAVSDYASISASGCYAGTLSAGLVLDLPQIELWDQSRIWARLRYDSSYSDQLVFTVEDFGSLAQ